MSLPVPTSRRYVTLDAWRALAALAVVAFHSVAALVPGPRAWWLRLMTTGWAGVFVFFPISGYCILGAVSRSENASARSFLWRRWRRIGPPYWASLVLAVAVLAASGVARGVAAADLDLGVRWVAMLTLTQGFAGIPGAINPVYWSLCYEEQFYLIVALTLCWRPQDRPAILLLVTAAAAIYQTVWPSSLRVTGLFLEYWLPFAAGLAAFAWLHLDARRAWAAGVFAIVALVAVLTWNVAMVVSLAAAIAIVALAPFDRTASATPSARWLIALGGASYSLYLVHVPVIGPVVHGLERLALAPAVSVPAGIAASVAAAWMFHRLIEQRFMNQPGGQGLRLAPVPAPAAVAVLRAVPDTVR